MSDNKEYQSLVIDFLRASEQLNIITFKLITKGFETPEVALLGSLTGLVLLPFATSDNKLSKLVTEHFIHLLRVSASHSEKIGIQDIILNNPELISLVAEVGAKEGEIIH